MPSLPVFSWETNDIRSFSYNPSLSTDLFPARDRTDGKRQGGRGRKNLLARHLGSKVGKGGSAVYQSSTRGCIRDLAWITELKLVGTVKDKICREGKAFVAETLWKRTG